MRELYNVISNAKWMWAHEYLNEATLTNLWEAVCWCKGCSVTQIPPIQTLLGLFSDPTDMMMAFASQFFPPDPTPIPIHHDDDPDPTPTHELIAIMADEVAEALWPTSNKSAPG
jgi:hypothetical protein